MTDMKTEQENQIAAIEAQGKLLDVILPQREEPIGPSWRQPRTMPFRYAGVDFTVTYKIDVNGDTELWDIKSEDDLLEVLRNSVLDEADNQIRRHAADNPKA